MKKLMKMATVVVGVGAMLSFAGCGEQDPVKKAANTFREINAAVISSGLKAEGLLPESEIVNLESGKLSDGERKEVIAMGEKFALSMDLFKKYLAGMKEIKSLDSEMYKDACHECSFTKFFDLSADEQKKIISEIEKNISKFKAYLSEIKK